MGKSSQYTHYMERVDITDSLGQIDIEEQFSGLLYMKAEGMNDVGDSMVIYTEKYPESDRLRVHVPPDDNYTNEATEIVMHFLVVGDALQRQATIKAFEDYVRKGIHRYWDDARNLEFDFVVKKKISVSDEKWHGSSPYVEIQVPMQNLNGSTRVH